MSLIEQLFAIIRNTFQESIRQPVLLVVAIAGTLFIVLSNPFATFTLESDQAMFIDIGLSSVFLAGVIGSAFVATNVLTREIENRTVLTVVSKPVPRPLFVIGKFLGVAISILVLMIYLILTFLLVEIHGSLETAASKYHMPVIIFGVSGLVLAIGAGVWCNYFYGWAFGATTLVILVPTTALVYLLCLVFDRNWQTQSIATEFNGQLWIACSMLFMAILVLCAIAIAASTRLGQVLTLVVTCGFFVLGLLSDWLFGRTATRLAENGSITEVDPTTGVETTTLALDGIQKLEYWGFSLAHAIVPNFQVFWLTDAVNQGSAIPAAYIGETLLYGGLLVAAALSIAVILFQRREVG